MLQPESVGAADDGRSASAQYRDMRNHRSDPSLRPVKWIVGSMVALLLGLGLTTTGAPDRSRQPDPPAVQPALGRHQVLQVDAIMTEQMALPNADTARQNHLDDPQLARSQDPNYVRLLEQHQTDVDQMLAADNP